MCHAGIVAALGLRGIAPWGAAAGDTRAGAPVGVAHLVSHQQATIAVMQPLGHCTPPAASGPCWHCTAFSGMLYAGSAARCALGGGRRVQAQPASGCAFWMRSIGTDDEPGPPISLDMQATLKPRAGDAQAVAWAP